VKGRLAFGAFSFGLAAAAGVAAAAVVAGLGGPAGRDVAAAPAAVATPWPRLAHVRTHVYYGLNDVNADVPAAWMAHHVDSVEDDGFEAQHALAFKRAGGQFAMAYTDPTYVPHCPPPFVPPAGMCEGPIGNLVARDESAWVHDARGTRVHRFVSARFQYQEILRVGSPSARRAYARTTAAILAKSPLLDAFEADDSGGTITSGDGRFGSNLWGDFSAPGVEFRSDEEWIAGEALMLAAAGRPVMLNGADPNWQPAYGGKFLDLPFVVGQQFEGCFNNGGGYRYTERDDAFRKEANGILAVQAHHKSAYCYPTGDTSPEHRLYAYAAWLLVFDPHWSVYEMEVAQSDGHALYPETELVPRDPARTANTVDDLRDGGAYVREFGACTISGRAIGACASVVNADSRATAALPRLRRAYNAHVELDARSLFAGGAARVARGVPQSLPPATAAILVVQP
jgi:hypothetical protein